MKGGNKKREKEAKRKKNPQEIHTLKKKKKNKQKKKRDYTHLTFAFFLIFDFLLTCMHFESSQWLNAR